MSFNPRYRYISLQDKFKKYDQVTYRSITQNNEISYVSSVNDAYVFIKPEEGLLEQQWEQVTSGGVIPKYLIKTRKIWNPEYNPICPLAYLDHKLSTYQTKINEKINSFLKQDLINILQKYKISFNPNHISLFHSAGIILSDNQITQNLLTLKLIGKNL